MKTIAFLARVSVILFALFPALAAAQDAAPASETSIFVFNTLFLLSSAAAAFLMLAGFCMIEAGMVRAKNAAAICLTKLASLAVAGLMVWLTGYNLLYGVEPGGFLGQFALWAPQDIDPVGAGVASAASFLFQTALAAVGVSIVAGALAERLRLAAFIVFAAAYAGVIYPVAASWDWGGGYLEADWKFFDFAGATLIHSAGGWAALAGALVIGARRGKFHGPKTHPMPGSNLPLAALGAFAVWFGWLGLNSGAHQSFASIGDAITIATIIVNANLAAAGGVLSALIMTAVIYKRADLTLVLNGVIGGLVSISADPMSPALWQAALIGGMGGVIVTVGAPLLDRFRIDDVVGAIPAHLFCGVWGTLVAPWTNAEIAIVGQIVGVVMVGGFVFVTSALVWSTLKFSIGARISADKEFGGLDRTELGLEAYPEFGV